MKLLIFSDIDGTFLSHDTYSMGALFKYIKNLNIDFEVIFNTSKTYEETAKINKKLQFNFPFIVENGACIFFPKNYMNNILKKKKLLKYKEHFCYKISRLEPNKVINLLSNIRKKYSFKFYNELSDKELKNITQLKISDIRLSQNRQFSNPILWMDSIKKKETFKKEFCLSNAGLLIFDGGKFLHILDKYDKGVALQQFLKIINLKKNSFKTISLGDSENDIPMLELTNFACIIKSRRGKKFILKNKKIYRSNQLAPDGWKESLEHVLTKEKINF